jgi:hypothetical protein
MGNTILAHVLYSCGKVELNLENFFSVSGNAHDISKVNHTEFTARHLVEYPNLAAQCILQLRSDEWFFVLQHRMSYYKWHNDVPGLLNWDKFFKREITSEDDWPRYYNAVREPDWPECRSFDEIDMLPEFMQQEIRSTYQQPKRTLTTESDLLEFLTQTYFDMFTQLYHPTFDAPVYKLSNYFIKKTQELENVSNQLGWRWDQHRSDNFHSAMLQANKDHLVWLEKIKKVHNNVVNSIQTSIVLETWEKAIVIAKVCETQNYNPKQLNWQTNNCILDQNNLLLTKSQQGN